MAEREPSQKTHFHRRESSENGEVVEEDLTSSRRAAGVRVPWVILMALLGGGAAGAGGGFMGGKGAKEPAIVAPWLLEKVNGLEKEVQGLKEGRAGDRGEILTELHNLTKKVDELADDVKALNRRRDR